MFSIAHIHLVVNHFPIVGSIFVTILFVIALVFRKVFLEKLSLWFLAGIALLTVVAYMSGDHAKAAVQGLPQVSDSLIFAHEQAARYALIIMFIAGVLSLVGILLYSRKPKLPNYFRIALLLVLLISMGICVYVGYLGGLIMHTEIRALVGLQL